MFFPVVLPRKYLITFVLEQKAYSIPNYPVTNVLLTLGLDWPTITFES